MMGCLGCLGSCTRGPTQSVVGQKEGHEAYFGIGGTVLLVVKPAEDLDGRVLLEHASADDGLGQSVTWLGKHKTCTHK